MTIELKKHGDSKYALCVRNRCSGSFKLGPINQSFESILYVQILCSVPQHFTPLNVVDVGDFFMTGTRMGIAVLVFVSSSLS